MTIRPKIIKYYSGNSIISRNEWDSLTPEELQAYYKAYLETPWGTTEGEEYVYGLDESDTQPYVIRYTPGKTNTWNPKAVVLGGNVLNRGQQNWRGGNLTHHIDDSMLLAAKSNYLYTLPRNSENRRADIQNYFNLNNEYFDTILDIINYYNAEVDYDREFLNIPRVYTGAKDLNTGVFNSDYYNMYNSKLNLQNDYAIEYQPDLREIYGTSTHLRQPTWYINQFDSLSEEDRKHRIHTITFKGKEYLLYEKDNGHISLLPKPSLASRFGLEESDENGVLPDELIDESDESIDESDPGGRYKGLWWKDKPSKISKISPYLSSLLGVGRFWNTLNTDRLVYNNMEKAIFPVLLLSYHTYRQVYGDEGTKLAYYKRAAEGQTKAGRPFTADADKQMAYQMEAKRIGDQLRAEGDRADNAEIRRTTDESMQHLWANVARDTQVANENRMAMAKAKAAKWELKAQRASVMGTSIDNYLRGLQLNLYRYLKEKLLHKEALDYYDYILGRDTNRNLLAANRLYDAAYRNYLVNPTSANLAKLYEAEKAIRRAEIEYRKSYELNHPPRYTPYIAKKGGKLNSDAEYLYRVSRDAVKHFREMSKQSDESRIKTLPKAVKLIPHPRSRRYLYGGQAPFMIYTPLVLDGGENTTSTQSSSGKDKKSEGKDKSLDVVKELFNTIKESGLPSDVSKVYGELSGLLRSLRARSIDGELNTSDLETLYLKSMVTVSNLKQQKEDFEKAKEKITANEGLNEYAVDFAGRLVVLDLLSGEIGRMSLDEYLSASREDPSKLAALTNSDVLNIREYGKPFDAELIKAVNQGIGILKISDFLLQVAGDLNKDVEDLEGYAKKEASTISSGIQILTQLAQAGLKAAPDGHYKAGLLTETQEKQVMAAKRYLIGVLPDNMKTIIKIHFGDLETGIDSVLAMKSGSNVKPRFDAVTGKAASKKDGEGDGDDKVKSGFLDLILRDQIGVIRDFNIVTRDTNSRLTSIGARYVSLLPNVGEDMSVEKMLYLSKVGTILDSRLGITFGDQIIDSYNLKDMMFDTGGGATFVTLPCKYQDGHMVVDLSIKDEYDKACEEASKSARVPVDYLDPVFLKALAEKLHEKGLDSLLNGDEIDPRMFGHFMVVSAYTTDKVSFNEDSRYVEKVKNPGTELESRMIRALSTNDARNNYSIDVDNHWGIFEGLHYDDVYRGLVFIPLNNDPVSALTGWGKEATMEQVQSMAEDFLNYQKIGKMRETSSKKII